MKGYFDTSDLTKSLLIGINVAIVLFFMINFFGFRLVTYTPDMDKQLSALESKYQNQIDDIQNQLKEAKKPLIDLGTPAFYLFLLGMAISSYYFIFHKPDQRKHEKEMFEKKIELAKSKRQKK